MIDLVERALVEGADRGGAGALEEGDGWARLTTAAASSEFRNAVLRSRLEPEEADARIEETIAHFDALGTPFRWFVTPSTRPRDMGERLLRRGFRLAPVIAAMTARPGDFPRPDAPDMDVVDVGPAEADAWVDTLRRGWDMPPPAVARFRAEIEGGLAARPRRSFYFLARWRGEPAAEGSLTLFDGYAHFDGSTTVPAYRRRGLYRALILARMAFLRTRGVGLVTNHCRADTSAPICARLGFEKACEFRAYRFPGG